MFVCLLWCGPKLNNSTRREIWTVQSKIYICTLLRVFGRMVGRSWSHWRRLAGFFFLYPTAPAVPLTRETTDMTSHMFVWRNNEWHFFFVLPPSCWIVTLLPPPEYIILSRVIDTQDFFFEVERERETREFDTDELSHVGRNLSLSGCLAFCDVVLWFILHHSYRVLCVYPESSTQRWSSSFFLLFA